MTVTTDLTLNCRCSTVRGVARTVAPRTGNHCICYCHDCQAFAHFLGHTGGVLDAHGGTDIFQLSPAQLELTEGADKVACIRLTPKGLLRWYASCCHTPIANTLPSANLPFVGLIRAFVREPASDALGAIRGYSFRQSATGDAASLPKGGLPAPLMIARVVGFMLRWRLRGDHRRSPFFDAATGQPRSVPRVLTEMERAALARRTGQKNA